MGDSELFNYENKANIFSGKGVCNKMRINVVKAFSQRDRKQVKKEIKQKNKKRNEKQNRKYSSFRNI